MLTYCDSKDCKSDTSLYCFVTPRACTCKDYKPSPAPLLGGADPCPRIPGADVVARNIAAHGKRDPKCPIPDAHQPIENEWRV